MYSEITASSLVKVNMQGDVVEEGTTNFGVNQAGFLLHSALHQSRPDIRAIIHLHTPNAVAVSQADQGHQAQARRPANWLRFVQYN